MRGPDTGPAKRALALRVDILAVGVALRRGVETLAALPPAAAGLPDARPASADEAPAAPASARSTAPGVSLAEPLARMTSHSR